MTADFETRCAALVVELGLGHADDIRSIEPLTGGVASDIGKVVLADRTICIKFAMPKLKVAEAGMDIPAEPILFNKSAATFCAPDAPILYSPKMTKLDWEVELGIVIGKRALNITKADALDHILGFTVVNDPSERAWQLERGGQWAKGKSFPNFCPTGPWIVTPDEVGDAAALPMWLDVNGGRMQTGNTKTMIFDPATIVSYLSEFMVLKPGDLICTGTPPGVGAGMNPPQFLSIGDTVSLGIEGLETQSKTVVVLEGSSWT
ncbi:fumarylacetoacetate hydrolase family protein [Paracoccaceae bacterium]|nr:fumarylacetoacetate hydrolase family protein [Paracoccaceae bacterium]